VHGAAGGVGLDLPYVRVYNRGSRNTTVYRLENDSLDYHHHHHHHHLLAQDNIKLTAIVQVSRTKRHKVL